MTESAEHKEKMVALEKEMRSKVKQASDKRGLFLVFTGEGKGKSTAAFGLALRAAGQGQKVAIIQFIKGTWKTGEKEFFHRWGQEIGVDFFVSGDGFTWITKDKEKDTASAERGLAIGTACIKGEPFEKIVAAKDYDVVILDEILVAIDKGYLDDQTVIQTVLQRPHEMSVVVTGRGATKDMIDAADTVTECKPVKHAFEAGLQARRGIEF